MSGISSGMASGLWAALRVPGYLRGRRWTELLELPPEAPRRPVPRGTRRAALAGVRAFAALPGLPWKNTCLYRSVAECLALRAYGVPAVVRIGVRADHQGEAGVVAHAWVVADPGAEPAPPDRMQPFSLRR